ncbi:MAG: L-histidine N(alpha)-methyltransferase [Bryobacteraceae bacterium]
MSNSVVSPTIVSVERAEFARSVRDGLTRPEQKELPSRYLYDDLGSALFEAITRLPEYGLTRADLRLLREHARDIVGRLPSPLVVAELGSGTGRKTRWLLEAVARREAMEYYPVDVSSAALEICERELGPLGAVIPIEAGYLEGLEQVVSRRECGQTLAVLFLGSTIGNFDPAFAEEFLRGVRGLLAPGDALLLGTDLEKGVPEMLLAYDDPAGVTAAFNLNLLGRVNRELGANFRLRQFEHLAIYSSTERRIEMHLRSRCRQTVEIPDLELNVRFEEGETIWTESCHKFRTTDLKRLAEHTGFRCEAQWIDREWPFAENLFIASAP